ncbi:MAG: hypothetical protein HFJ28_06725 [Clostridia bacterium]|nr:hypothetical protein [Clostridia bacterium]
MTFKRDFLLQKAGPHVLITNFFLLFFILLSLPPEFNFCYGLGVNLINLLWVFKGVWIKNKTDFEYTISYNKNQLQISLASGETHTYNRKTLKANKNALFFWIKDGKQQHIYPYNDKVIAFLDQLE